MVTITDQDIPGALVAIFGQYAAKGKATQGASGTLRGRKRIKKRPYKKRPNKYHAALWPLCVFAATNYAERYPATTITPLALRIFAQAKRGVFSSPYWTTLTHTATTYHQTAPSSVERTTTNPYAYRHPNNRPTIPTYPAASAGSAPARYTGATAAELFRDTLLVYRRDTFVIDPPAPLSADLRIIYQANGTTTANASTRAARPLTGLTVAAAAGAAGVSPITDTAPPIGKGAAVYPRYKTKKTPAPYYTATAPYSLTRLLNPTRAASPPPTAERAVVDLAPLPAMGYRYNNNTSISTSTDLSANPAARIPLQPLPALPFVAGGTWPFTAISPYTGAYVSPGFSWQAFTTNADGLHYYVDNGDTTITVYDATGTPISTIKWQRPEDQMNNAPWLNLKGIAVDHNRSHLWDPHTLIEYYDWTGALYFTEPTDYPPPAPTGRPYGLRPASKHHYYTTESSGITIYGDETIPGIWTFTPNPLPTRVAASADAVYMITSTGDFWLMQYPVAMIGTDPYQPPLSPVFVTTLGWVPTTIHRCTNGALLYSLATGFRHLHSDGTWTQYAATAPETPLNNSAFNYSIHK